MNMTLTDTPGSMKRFRRSTSPWKFQATFLTPLKNLPNFVATISSAYEPFEIASITIDEVIFTPENLLKLFAKHSLPERYGHDLSIAASSHEEVKALLQAAFTDSVDFIFVPKPKPFVIYADHDEYTTFYANTKSNLNRIVHALSDKGFQRIEDYQRNL